MRRVRLGIQTSCAVVLGMMDEGWERRGWTNGLVRMGFRVRKSPQGLRLEKV